MTAVVRRVTAGPLAGPLTALALTYLAGLALAGSTSWPDAFGIGDRLLAWDASWYRELADRGYGGAPDEAIRFFPLLPVFGWLLASAPGVDAGAAVAVAALVGTLAALAAVRQVVTDRFGAGVGDTAAWMLVAWPANIALALAYPTGWTVAATILTLERLERGRFGHAAAWAAVAALARPTGLLLIVPIVVVAIRDRRTLRPLMLPALATTAGVVTMGAVSLRHHDAVDAFRSAQTPLRGDIVDPLSRIATGVADLAGRDILDGLHLGFVILVLGLVVLAFRLLPRSWAVHATAVVLVTVSVENWNSFERYVYDAPQLLVAAAVATSRASSRTRIAAVAVGLVTATVVTALALSGEYVP